MQSILFRKGDTLSAIAKANHTTVDALLKANNLQNTSLIGDGQFIKIPDKYELSPPSPFSEFFSPAQPGPDALEALSLSAPAPASTPTLRKGASGAAVSEMQPPTPPRQTPPQTTTFLKSMASRQRRAHWERPITTIFPKSELG